MWRKKIHRYSIPVPVKARWFLRIHLFLQYRITLYDRYPIKTGCYIFCVKLICPWMIKYQHGHLVHGMGLLQLHWPATGQFSVRLAPMWVLILPPTTIFRLALCRSDMFFQEAIITGCSVQVKEKKKLDNQSKHGMFELVWTVCVCVWMYMTHQPIAPALFLNQIPFHCLLCTCRFRRLWRQGLRSAVLQYYPTKPQREEKRHQISRRIRLGRLNYSVWFPHPHMPH